MLAQVLHQVYGGGILAVIMHHMSIVIQLYLACAIEGRSG